MTRLAERLGVLLRHYCGTAAPTKEQIVLEMPSGRAGRKRQQQAKNGLANIATKAPIPAKSARLLGACLALLLPLPPSAIDRLTDVPVGIALAGLGFSLWREQRTVAIDTHTPSRRALRS